MIKSDKIIYCNYLSRFSNNIFQYCYAHLLNQRFNGTIKFSSDCTLSSGDTHDNPSTSEPLIKKPVYEITDSKKSFLTKEQMGKFRYDEQLELSSKYQFNPELDEELTGNNIILSDYFQNYKYYRNNKTFIRSLLYRLYKKELNDYPSQYDIVAHYRGTDIHIQTPVDYYLDVLNKEKDFERLFIVTDEPNNPNVQYLYNKINKYKFKSAYIKSTFVLDDFLFIMNASRIIMSVSTFSWMSAWLSDAEKIYFPIDNYLFNRDGDQRLIVDNEPRYNYINIDKYTEKKTHVFLKKLKNIISPFDSILKPMGLK